MLYVVFDSRKVGKTYVYELLSLGTLLFQGVYGMLSWFRSQQDHLIWALSICWLLHVEVFIFI